VVANTLGDFRRADAPFGLSSEGALYDAIFQAVIADNHQPPAGLEEGNGLFEPSLQVVQLVVDGDA